MINEEQIDKAIKDLFSKLSFTQEPTGLYDPLRYMVAIGGKRLRPALCLATYGLYKDDIDDSVLQPAAGLELFHSFTLIHDDIMDKSSLRRGVSTVWTKWGEDGAILSGDAMCIDSYKRIAKAPINVLPEALELFSTTAGQVCDGQRYDIDFEQRESVGMDEYMKMIGLKTGVLIACSAKMGALIAGASSEDCDNLYNYGYYIGLSFQVADDYLDAYGDEKVFGKPIGGDILNNKKCWLTTKAFEKASKEQKEALDKAMNMPADSNKIQAVKEIYSQLNIENEAKDEILRLHNIAIVYANKVCDGEKLEILKRFADKLIGRTK